jgi:hypothetical protein
VKLDAIGKRFATGDGLERSKLSRSGERLGVVSRTRCLFTEGRTTQGEGEEGKRWK